MRLPSGRRRLALHVAWQAAVTALFVMLATRVLDFAELRAALAGADWRWIPPALLLFTFAKYIDSWRWRYLLRGTQSPPQPALFGAFLIGNMVNNLLPLRAGDVAKIQVLANRYGTPRASLAASVFVVEATLDGVVFTLFLFAGLAFAGLAEAPGFSMRGVGALAALAVAVFAVALVLARSLHRLRVPRRWRQRLEDVRDHLRDGLHALRSWRRTLGAVALSIPAWLIEAGTFALAGRAFGIDVGFEVFVAVMIAANVAVAVPVALWNIGPYEAAVTAALALAGVAGAVALSYAIAVHLLVNVWIQITGLLTFWITGVRPREVISLGAREPVP
jgi:glycosyltransferase 2 family protein